MSDLDNEHERLVQQMHERVRQFRLEARRNAIPRFGPAVDGVLWSRIRPGEEDEESQTPILGILECTLKPGINIQDKTGSPRRLWEAVLCYIGSIPGCCGIEWGSRLDGDPSGQTSIFCLVHWENTAAWRTFQYSPGFTPIIGLLNSEVSNRCAKPGPSGAPRLGCGADAQDRATVVDVVSVAMAAEDVSSPESLLAFEDAWKSIVEPVTNGRDGLQHWYAVWLENNATTFFDPSPAEAAAATKQAIFTAFLAWDAARYESRHIEELCGKLQALPPSILVSGPTSVSRKQIQLINRQNPQLEVNRHNAPQQPAAAQHNSLASILHAGFPRKCGADLVNISLQAQQALDRSISDARARKRLFPAARGSFRCQGELYEGNLPPIPLWRRGPVSIIHGGFQSVDVIWMQLKSRAPKSQGARIHLQLRDEMSALPGFVKSFWARDVEHQRKLAVLIVWEDVHAREAASQACRRILDDFVASSVHLAAPLKHQAFLIRRYDGAAYLLSWRTPHLELISFHVPAGAAERRMFEHAYGAFIDMTHPSLVAGIPTACSVVSDAGGWQADAGGPAGEIDPQHQLFTGVLEWDSPAARREWYGELFRLACWSYELFGQTIDTLGILAAGGVEARFLELQCER